MSNIQIDAAALQMLVDCYHPMESDDWTAVTIAQELLRDHAAREQQAKRDFMGTAHPDHPAQQMQRTGKEIDITGGMTSREYVLEGRDDDDDDTPTQSGECAAVCECGHDRDAHNGEFGCLETNGAILICNCKYYRDRARGGR